MKMMYRIRYRCNNTSKQAETTVEANSPNEALVKFQHAHKAYSRAGEMPGPVTSVSPEDSREALPW